MSHQGNPRPSGPGEANKAQYISSLNADKAQFAPNGLMTASLAGTAVKVDRAAGVIKSSQHVNLSTTYTNTYVQAADKLEASSRTSPQEGGAARRRPTLSPTAARSLSAGGRVLRVWVDPQREVSLVEQRFRDGLPCFGVIGPDPVADRMIAAAR